MSNLDRREFLTSLAAAGVAAGGVPIGADRERGLSGVAQPGAAATRQGPGAPAFRPLPLGAIRPAGWLARQLRIQADGLTGHLDQFWPDVADSQWFGGKAEGWERAPYWLDGAIPLAFAERLERVAFNALPATFTPDMWAHQYDQQVNQVQCTVNPDHGFTTNGPESNLYGLEPNFGCCTSNMHQGWPKFTAHLWMVTEEGELVAASYAPCRVETKLRGVPVALDVETDYPFRDTVTLHVAPGEAATLALRLRVPAWAEGATVRVGDGAAQPMKAGTLHRLEHAWPKGTTRVTLRFPMRTKVTVRYNEAVAVERGPLVYALKMGEEWTRVNADKPHRELPHGDFEVRPASPWNYGLVVDESKPDAGLRFEERPVGAQPFSPDGAGMAALAPARRIPSWKIQRGWAGEISPADVAWSDPSRQPTEEPVETVTLLPCGCTNIRIAEFPRVRGA